MEEALLVGAHAPYPQSSPRRARARLTRSACAGCPPRSLTARFNSKTGKQSWEHPGADGAAGSSAGGTAAAPPAHAPAAQAAAGDKRKAPETASAADGSPPARARAPICAVRHDRCRTFPALTPGPRPRSQQPARLRTREGPAAGQQARRHSPPPPKWQRRPQQAPGQGVGLLRCWGPLHHRCGRPRPRSWKDARRRRRRRRSRCPSLHVFHVYARARVCPVIESRRGRADGRGEPASLRPALWLWRKHRTIDGCAPLRVARVRGQHRFSPRARARGGIISPDALVYERCLHGECRHAW